MRLKVPCHVRNRPVNGRSVDACEQPVSGHFFRPENTSTNSPASQIVDPRFRDNDVPDWFDLSVVCLTLGALPSGSPLAGAVLLDQPLARPAQLQAGTVDQQVDRPTGGAGLRRQLQALGAPAEGARSSAPGRGRAAGGSSRSVPQSGAAPGGTQRAVSELS